MEIGEQDIYLCETEILMYQKKKKKNCFRTIFSVFLLEQLSTILLLFG